MSKLARVIAGPALLYTANPKLVRLAGLILYFTVSSEDSAMLFLLPGEYFYSRAPCDTNHLGARG
jgi:hypothetical protein